MANWCENKLTVSGSEKELKKFKIAVKNDRNEQGLKYWETVPDKSDVRKYVLIYRFESRYSPAIELVASLSRQFSKLKFKVGYYEYMMNYEGTAYIKNGEISNGRGEIPGLEEYMRLSK
ncbi:MAG: hypothetical protein NT093_00370 [Candidatus Moranbacteria bacterium]|nr:hypothetical protein [Candidatus Moranbacteria bacterium]